jgi:cytochrome P450
MTVTTEPLVLPLRDPEFWQDPYPLLAEARRRHRTARSESGEIVLLSAADVEAASSHPALVPLGLDALDRLGMGDGPFRRWRALSLNAQVGDDHNRLRSLVGRAFSPRQVERVRVQLRAHLDNLLEGTAGRTVDVHAELGHEAPLFSICAFLGIPVEDRERIDGFMVGTEEGFSYPMTSEKQARADAGIDALYGYASELIDRRRRSTGDDLVSGLVLAEIEGDRLTHDELLAMIVNLIGGAVGSSDAGIANMVHLLATEPHEADVARGEPALVPAFVEEVLRYRPPFRSTRRKATAAVEIAGEQLEPGRTVLLSRQAANRDPERFADPDRFRVRRAQERHLSFGYGPHYCLGQALARLNLTETASAVLERWSAVELVDREPRRVPFDPTERFETLRVRAVPSEGSGRR